jgi:CBS domain-containing protein
MKDLTVLEAKRFGVVTCLGDTTLYLAARKMIENDISTLVVVDEAGYLRGIITRTDLIRALCCQDDWRIQLVQDWMNPAVHTVSEHDNLFHVGQVLLDNQIHRVIAVREEGGRQVPLAVVSTADLVYHMAHD